MTSRERFYKVIKGKIPDRVPVTLFIQHQGHFITQVYPDVDMHDSLTLDLKVIEIQKQLGTDVFVRLLFDFDDPESLPRGGLDVNKQTENWEVETERVTNENVTIYRSTIKTPEGILTQDFSVNEIRKGTYVHACTKKPIHSLKDLEIAIKYEPKMTDAFKHKVNYRVEKVKEALGEDGIVGIWAPHGPFNNASLIMDLETLYSLYLTNYAFYEKIMNFAIDRTKDYAMAMISSGVDVLIVSANVPGGFLGPAIYKQYVLPFEQRFVELCQKTGIPVLYHNCGEIMNLVESYKKLGVKMVEPFSPPPLGDADLAEAKKIVDGAYVMIGGVDQVNVLQKGTVEQVREVTKKTIETGKPGGKFILQSADFLEYGTPLENIEAFVKTGIENAWY